MKKLNEQQAEKLLNRILKLEGHAKQLCELDEIKHQLTSVLRVPSTSETATHMAVRLAAEREIQGRKDYLCEYIAINVINALEDCGML